MLAAAPLLLLFALVVVNVVVAVVVFVGYRPCHSSFDNFPKT